MKLFPTILVTSIALVASHLQAAKPLRALIITGGCCHDYKNQKNILSNGISARANVTFDLLHEGGPRAITRSAFTRTRIGRRPTMSSCTTSVSARCST